MSLYIYDEGTRLLWPNLIKKKSMLMFFPAWIQSLLFCRLSYLSKQSSWCSSLPYILQWLPVLGIRDIPKYPTLSSPTRDRTIHFHPQSEMWLWDWSWLWKYEWKWHATSRWMVAEPAWAWLFCLVRQLAVSKTVPAPSAWVTEWLWWAELSSASDGHVVGARNQPLLS